MASLNGAIDTDAELPGSFEVFAAGTYKGQIIESDIVPTKKGDGKLLKYRFEITEGDEAKRLIFGQFNLTNPNPIAAKIGQGEFKALRALVEVGDDLEDTADMHFREFLAVVKITPAKTVNGTTYDAKNEIDWGKSYALKFGETSAGVATNDNVKNSTAVGGRVPAAKAAAPVGAVKKAAWPKKAA